MKITRNQPVNIPVSKLRPFEGHPFKVKDDDEMNTLIESVQTQGVLSPLIVRPIEDTDEYEVVSGHRRLHAAQKAGINEVPALIYALDRDAAAIAVVDSNLHREHILPSEKAFAYRMKLEAMSRQGHRSDLTSDQLGRKLETAEIIAQQSDDSKSQVRRYIRLTYLISPILQMVDESRMAFNPAVEISYMTPEHQRWLQAEMELCEATPSLVQSRRLKEMSQSGTLTEHYLHTLLTEQKPNQRQKFFLNQSDVQRFFPPGYTPEQMQNTIFSLLKTWGHAHEHTQSQQELER